jgi:copper chaperone CopZ
MVLPTPDPLHPHAGLVPDISSGHCRAAIAAEVSVVGGVESVDVDLETKLVRVIGCALEDAAIRQAIREAGYTAAHSFDRRGGVPMSRIRRAWRYIIDRPLV